MAAEVVTFQTDCWYLDKITQLGSRGATKKLAFPNSNRIWNFLFASSSRTEPLSVAETSMLPICSSI